MAYTVTATDTQLFTAVRSFLLSVIGSDTEVVRELSNRVPNPLDSFVLMSLLFRNRLATNQSSYTDTPTVGQVPGVHTEQALMASSVAMQLDFFGFLAGDWAALLSIVWRSHWACDTLGVYGIAPLYTDDARKIPYVSGENQYESRWTLTVYFQANPVVTTAQDFFDQVPAPAVIPLL